MVHEQSVHHGTILLFCAVDARASLLFWWAGWLAGWTPLGDAAGGKTLAVWCQSGLRCCSQRRFQHTMQHAACPGRTHPICVHCWTGTAYWAGEGSQVAPPECRQSCWTGDWQGCMRKAACQKHEAGHRLLTTKLQQSLLQDKAGSRQLPSTGGSAMSTAAALDAPRLMQACRLPQSSLKHT